MKKAFKTELRLTPELKIKVHQTIGVCRYVYNLYVKTAQDHYKATGKHMSGYDFSKWLNNVYTKEHDPWIKEVSSKAVKQAIMNGDRAFRRFFKGLAKFPRFKKKKRQKVKAYFPKNNLTDLTVERHRIKVPTIGWVQLKEHGYIPTNAAVSSCTISQQADRYFLSVLCEVEETSSTQINNHEGIGIDLGIQHFAICSHGELFGNINKSDAIKKIGKRLKRHQRKLSRSYEQNKQRKRGEFCAKNRQKMILRVQKLHARLSRIRQAYIRYVIQQLVKTKPLFITIEDLNVQGMMKNRHLAKAIASQGFYTFRQLLQTQCRKHGIELRQVDRWHPSSKLCSGCGEKNVTLRLSDRMFSCASCGIEMDRDVNASLNLKLATAYTILA